MLRTFETFKLIFEISLYDFGWKPRPLALDLKSFLENCITVLVGKKIIEKKNDERVHNTIP